MILMVRFKGREMCKRVQAFGKEFVLAGMVAAHWARSAIGFLVWHSDQCRQKGKLRWSRPLPSFLCSIVQTPYSL